MEEGGKGLWVETPKGTGSRRRGLQRRCWNFSGTLGLDVGWPNCLEGAKGGRVMKGAQGHPSFVSYHGLLEGRKVCGFYDMYRIMYWLLGGFFLCFAYLFPF